MHCYVVRNAATEENVSEAAIWWKETRIFVWKSFNAVISIVSNPKKSKVFKVPYVAKNGLAPVRGHSHQNVHSMNGNVCAPI